VVQSSQRRPSSSAAPHAGGRGGGMSRPPAMIPHGMQHRAPAPGGRQAMPPPHVQAPHGILMAVFDTLNWTE